MSNSIKKSFILFLILTVSLFSISGCSSSYNIDNLAYIVALGLDVGENNDLRISFQLSVPGSSKGGGSSQSDSTIVNSIDCATIDSGINLLNSYLSKEVNLSHCKVIIFSEQLAYNGISDYLYTLMNNIQIRPDCNVIVSRCTAEYFLNNSKPILEKLSARYYDIAPTSSEYTAYTENITLSEFFSNFKDTFSECYAILGGVNTSDTHDINNSENSIEKDTNNKANETMTSAGVSVENMGLAVFSDDKLVGELTAIETLCHQIITNKLQLCNILVPSPFKEGSAISLHLKLYKNTKNKVKLVNGSPFINSKIYLDARVQTLNESSDYLDEKNIALLEEYAESYLKEQINSYLYKVSKEYNADIDGFGKYAVSNFLTWDDWTNYNWLGNYRNSFFDVDVNVRIKSSYIILKT